MCFLTRSHYIDLRLDTKELLYRKFQTDILTRNVSNHPNIESFDSSTTEPSRSNLSGPTHPFGTETLAPSRMACAIWKSRPSAALVAARSASQISLRPSKAGAVSQNSSLLDLSCPSVSGTSDRHRMVSWQSGRFLRAAPMAMPRVGIGTRAV